MKRIILAVIVLVACFVSSAEAANKFYWATGLTGGGAALDGIDGAGLAAGDAAIVVLDSGTNAPMTYFYRLQASSASESSPWVIVPNSNAGTSAWHLSGQIAGTIQAPAKFVSFAGAATLTAAGHNGALVMMTTADEVTMWDCTTSTIGHWVTLWARDAEKIEVVPASGDQFYLLAGTGIGANDELDIAATAGTKVTLMCTAENEWRVVYETAACADGGAAD